MNSRADRYAHLEWRETRHAAPRSTWNRPKAKRRSWLASILGMFA